MPTVDEVGGRFFRSVRAKVSQHRWFAAIGAVLLASLATLAASPSRVATGVSVGQDPTAFDPIFPWYEREYPWVMDAKHVTDAAALAKLAPTENRIGVPIADRALVDAVVRRDGVRDLALTANGQPVELAPDLWRDFGAMPAAAATETAATRDSLRRGHRGRRSAMREDGGFGTRGDAL